MLQCSIALPLRLFNGLSTQDRFYQPTIEPRKTDDNQPAGRRLVAPPRPVEVTLDALTPGLHGEPHRLAGHGGKTLDAQDVMRCGGVPYPGRQLVRSFE